MTVNVTSSSALRQGPPQGQRQMASSPIAMEVAVETQEKEAERASTAGIRNFVSGTVAGIVGKFFEYPMDTLKVRQQTATVGANSTILAITKQIFRTQGVGGFYKGIASPVIGAAAENAVLFTSFGTTTRLLQGPDGEIPFSGVLISGMVAGVFVSKVLTPVELIKCRMQAQTAQDQSKQMKYKNSFHCLTTTLKEEGLFKGLYKGHTSMLLREVPGNAGWFGAYEGFCRLMTPPGKTKDDLPPYILALAGGLGGMCYWSAFFPADVVKSKIQTGQLPPEINSFGKAFSYVYQTEGFKGLYRGLGITLTRAIPANALIFSTYETVSRFLKTLD